MTPTNSYVRMPRRLRPLLDTGRPALWTPERRRHLGRCQSCEFHPPTQGHDAWCPADDAATPTLVESVHLSTAPDTGAVS